MTSRCSYGYQKFTEHAQNAKVKSEIEHLSFRIFSKTNWSHNGILKQQQNKKTSKQKTISLFGVFYLTIMPYHLNFGPAVAIAICAIMLQLSSRNLYSRSQVVSK